MTVAQRFCSGYLLKRTTWITPVILSALVLGCSSSTGNRSQTVAPPPFVFRKLELEQKKSSGDVDWKLSSPEARYELSRRLVRAKRPEGVLYSKNKPSFKIRADFAIVINDGEQIMLEGDVPSPVNPPTGCRFRTRCWKATELCAVEEPQLVVRSSGQQSACHFPE